MTDSAFPGHANLPIGCSEDANREIGVPREEDCPVADDGEGRWRSRGYMPHFDQPDRLQHVTFHLADSLPRHVLEQMEEEIRTLPHESQDAERRKRIENWLDAGYGSCVLRVPEVGRKVQESLLFFDGERYRMIAWVVMPNHVHVLFEQMSGWKVNKVVASWKKFTARAILDYQRTRPEDVGLGYAGPGHANEEIRTVKTANREIGVPRGDANPTIRVPSGPVWHKEFWDRFIRDERHFERALEYIHANPLTAGLVKEAEVWPWSSAAVLRHDVQDANREIGVPRKEPDLSAT